MAPRIHWICSAVFPVLALGIADLTQAQQPDLGKKARLEFNPRTLVDPRPAITNAPFLKAGEVTDEVTDGELVLGVVVNDKARAYPINQLTGPSREIINDTLGDRDIAATW